MFKQKESIKAKLKSPLLCWDVYVLCNYGGISRDENSEALMSPRGVPLKKRNLNNLDN